MLTDFDEIFYRATLCVRAVFALCSVRLDCIQTAKDTVKLLSRPGSPSF